MTVAGPGFTLKLPGSLQADPVTGRLTTVLTDLPELPLSRLTLRFKGGPRAPLVTSASCGTGTASARADALPRRAGLDAHRVGDDRQRAGRRGLPGRGAVRAHLRGRQLARRQRRVEHVLADGAAAGRRRGARAPAGSPARGADGAPGRRAALPDGGRDRRGMPGRQPHRIARRSRRAQEPSPYPLTGDVYLTDAYRDASLGLALTLRALAGPLDLGTVVVPATLRMDPLDGHLTIAIDPLPTILDGVPLRLRTLRVDIDRPGFLVNPTACSAARITATIRGAVAATACPAVPYTLRGCRGLRFAPKLSVALTGGRELRRGGHPGLTITMRLRARDANVRAADGHAAQGGDARRGRRQRDLPAPARERATAARAPRAWGRRSATTPLLAEPLAGSVYVVRPKGSGKPDLWAIVQR